MNIKDVSWTDVRDKLKSSDLLIVPLAATEPYGPHLAMGTPTYVTEYLAGELGNRLDCLVAPTIPASWTENLGPFPGNLHVPPSVVKAYVKAICDRMVEWGIRRLFFLNIHKRNIGLLDELSHEYLTQGVMCAQAHYWALVTEIGKDLLIGELPMASGHGAELSVAVALAVKPDLVFPDRFRISVPSPRLADRYPEVMICAPFTDTTHTGHVGDPSHATAETGHRVLEGVIRRLESFLREWTAESAPPRS